MADEEKTEEATTIVVDEAPESGSEEQGGEAAETNEAARAELVKGGVTKEEMERMAKRGIIPKDVKPEAKKKEGEADDKEEKGEEGEKGKPPKNFGIPDVDLTPEQEADFLKHFGKGHPVRGMFLRMKSERKARQAEAKKGKEAVAAKEQEIAILKAKLEGKGVVEGEEGEEDDLDSRTLTVADLKKYEEEKAKTQREQAEAAREKHTLRGEAIKDQETYAKEVFEDWEETVGLVEKVLDKEAFAEMPKWKQNKALALVRELQVAYATADEVDYDGRSAAMIAYEMGQLHESYGEKPKETVDSGRETPKGRNTGGLSPEQMRRIEENSKKRQSSASVTGSQGKREVAVADVTPQMFRGFNAAQRTAFRKEHPKRYLELMRG